MGQRKTEKGEHKLDSILHAAALTNPCKIAKHKDFKNDILLELIKNTTTKRLILSLGSN